MCFKSVGVGTSPSAHMLYACQYPYPFTPFAGVRSDDYAESPCWQLTTPMVDLSRSPIACFYYLGVDYLRLMQGVYV